MAKRTQSHAGRLSSVISARALFVATCCHHSDPVKTSLFGRRHLYRRFNAHFNSLARAPTPDDNDVSVDSRSMDSFRSNAHGHE